LIAGNILRGKRTLICKKSLFQKIDSYLINFVVDVKARHVLPVALDDVNELVSGGILPEQDLRIKNL
jgi:hypothetical protein